MSDPRLPDFLVIGAQKSGSTDLCSHLASHPDVCFARPKELYFFCRDDVSVLPYPFFERYDEWRDFDWDGARDRLLERYGRHFADATEGQLCGEGTPFYLPSRIAADRVAQTLPDAKLVVILRNPIDRAHSAYWHHVKMRRSTETFENHLRYETGGTLAFGHYEEHLRMWRERFDPARIHVVLFEEYVKDRVGHSNLVFAHLGLTPVSNGVALHERQNTARVPGSPRLQRLLNKLQRTYRAHGGTIEYDTEPPREPMEWALSKALRGLGRLNLSLESKYPAMDPQTRARLDVYYRRRNAGLAELLGRDLAPWGWT